MIVNWSVYSHRGGWPRTSLGSCSMLRAFILRLCCVCTAAVLRLCCDSAAARYHESVLPNFTWLYSLARSFVSTISTCFNIRILVIGFVFIRHVCYFCIAEYERLAILFTRIFQTNDVISPTKHCSPRYVLKKEGNNLSSFRWSLVMFWSGFRIRL